MAIIPGIAMDDAGRKQSFIQVLDGKRKSSVYHRFDFDEFSFSDRSFNISIGKNTFSEKFIVLDLPQISGRLDFTGNVSWPKPWYSPGIMGPYAFVPFMECYHGIVSMDHSIAGTLSIGSESVSFERGRGYIEKDWGRSFPKAYVWMQSNHFSQSGISVKVSVAKIPWLRKSFVGFIAGVWIHNRLIRFTTYNKSSLTELKIAKENVRIVLENRQYRLQIDAARDDATGLASPILGLMDGRIEESMTSILEITVTDKKNGRLILKDKGRNTGIEVAGDVSLIEKQLL
jgi:tocopherol cyclase